MAKDAHKPNFEEIPEEAMTERLELKVPEGFGKLLKRAGKKQGMGRSAYVRFACIQQMKRDAEGTSQSDR